MTSSSIKAFVGQAALPAEERLADVAATLSEHGAQRLNEEQRRAVAAMLCSSGEAIYALNGPPGTGKTVRSAVAASGQDPTAGGFRSCWWMCARQAEITPAEMWALTLSCFRLQLVHRNIRYNAVWTMRIANYSQLSLFKPPLFEYR